MDYFTDKFSLIKDERGGNNYYYLASNNYIEDYSVIFKEDNYYEYKIDNNNKINQKGIINIDFSLKKIIILYIRMKFVLIS